ncbi:MAG: TIR domain-containing protein [Pseudomonadota bacterium]
MKREYDVFISYKREEHTLATQLGAALATAGYSHVSDVNLKHGDHFGDAIDRMIRNSRLVIVLWTPSSSSSDWVKNEARLADKLGKYFGVMVEKTVLPVDLEFKHHQDVVNIPFSEALVKIVDAVAPILGVSPNTRSAAETRSTTLNDDLRLFETAERLGTVTSYEAYLSNFSDGVMTDVAEERLKRLKTVSYRIRKGFPNLTAIAAIAAMLTGILQVFFSEDVDRWLSRNSDLDIALQKANDFEKKFAKGQEDLKKVENNIANLVRERGNHIAKIAKMKEELDRAESAAAGLFSPEYVSEISNNLSELRSELEKRNAEVVEKTIALRELKEIVLKQQQEIRELRGKVVSIEGRFEARLIVDVHIGVKDSRHLDGASVCVIVGSKEYDEIVEYFSLYGLQLFLQPFTGSNAENRMVDAYRKGVCDALAVPNGMVDNIVREIGAQREILVLQLS